MILGLFYDDFEYDMLFFRDRCLLILMWLYSGVMVMLRCFWDDFRAFWGWFRDDYVTLGMMLEWFYGWSGDEFRAFKFYVLCYLSLLAIFHEESRFFQYFLLNKWFLKCRTMFFFLKERDVHENLWFSWNALFFMSFAWRFNVFKPCLKYDTNNDTCMQYKCLKHDTFMQLQAICFLGGCIENILFMKVRCV